MTNAARSSRIVRNGPAHVLRRARAVATTVLAVTASVVSSMMVLVADGYLPGQQEIQPGWRAVLGLLLACGAGVALCWRHHYPLHVTAFTVVAPLLLIADAMAALIALAALAANRRDRMLWFGTGAVYLATSVAVWHDSRRHAEYSPMQWIFGAMTEPDRADIPLPAVLVVAAVLTAIPVCVGLLRGTHRELSRSVRTEQDLVAEMTRQEERSRIAREMHDVLGHRLSLLSLQAGALEVSQDQARTAEVAQIVGSTARQALEDLRHVIGVLRDGPGLSGVHPDGNGSPRREPTLAELPDLIGNARRSGLAVNVTVLLDNAASAPAELGTAAFRIVQESLTNALRHAPCTTVDVSVRGGPVVGLTIEASNPVPELDHPGMASIYGNGLTGIAERVSMLGGKVSCGPTDSGTFAVAAWLPWPNGHDNGPP